MSNKRGQEAFVSSQPMKRQRISGAFEYSLNDNFIWVVHAENGKMNWISFAGPNFEVVAKMYWKHIDDLGPHLLVMGRDGVASWKMSYNAGEAYLDLIYEFDNEDLFFWILRKDGSFEESFVDETNLIGFVNKVNNLQIDRKRDIFLVKVSNEGVTIRDPDCVRDLLEEFASTF